MPEPTGPHPSAARGSLAGDDVRDDGFAMPADFTDKWRARW